MERKNANPPRESISRPNLKYAYYVYYVKGLQPFLGSSSKTKKNKSMLTRIGKLLTVKNQKTKTFSHESDSYKAVLVKTESGDVKCLMFTENELFKAEMRGIKNPEDQPMQSWISRLID